MTDLNKALAKLPQPLRADVANHWSAFLDQLNGAQLPADSHLLEQLSQVWAASDFVARSCLREPQLLIDLIHQEDLARSYSDSQYRERLVTLLSDTADETQLGQVLRQFRRREMLRIAWRDIAHLATLTETLLDLSNLADAIIDAALAKLHRWHCHRYGTPRNHQQAEQQLVVLGMGKLGGQELNFSSDIDLIFAYPEKGETDGLRPISNEEFFRRLGQRLINVLAEATPEGFVFRVDMRLRPFGQSGPLTMPFTALEEYYQTHGREWERYALIKARAIAGDIATGERLLQHLQPFVYRRYLDYSAFESLRSMKALITKEVERKGLQRNIKLGPGGIREIEFIGQAFQLIYGGREPELRCRSILAVLDYLAHSERLATDTVTRLKRAYDFLRRSENRLQIWRDQQTHNLPTQEQAQLRLAHTMGFNDWSTFSQALEAHMSYVREQFQLVFGEPSAPEATGTDFAALWAGTVSDDAAEHFLRQQGFETPQQALHSLQQLHSSFSYRALSESGRLRLQQLLPLLLAEMADTPDPQATLDRITRLLQAIARRSTYLSLLLENPVAREQLIKLCSASTWIADYLSRYPLLLDDLLDPRSLYTPLDTEQLEQELQRDLVRAGDDSEAQLNALRHFKQTNILRVAAADISAAMPLMVVSDHLTEIAEVILHQTLILAWRDLVTRFGQPHCVINGETVQPGFAIIAYGKLGGLELSYGSDLDVVFLHDSDGEQQYTDGERQADNSTFFAKLAQRIIHILSAHTAAGVLYEADTRLRPSGRAGLLVSRFDAFAEYQRQQAWTWEHQALVRTRFIVGPDSLKQRFAALRREILSQPRDLKALRQEVFDMRERMRTELGSKQTDQFHLKQDRGGIADIEFMVQYLILAHAHQHPELTTYSDNIRQLAGLEYTGILSSADASQLRSGYRALRAYAHRLTLEDQSSVVATSDLGELDQHRKQISTLWQKLLGPA